MANTNDTVEQVCEKLHKLGGEMHRLVVLGEDEIHTLSHTIDEAQDRLLAAHKRELSAKDEEIASMMGDMEKLLKNGDLLCVQKVKMEREIEKRNALIKELADALEYNECYRCTYNCATCTCKDHKNALVAKAREVVNG